MNRIKEELQKQNKSMYWLMQETGFSYPTIRKWVLNRGQPPLDVLFRISNILNVEPKDLIKYEN